MYLVREPSHLEICAAQREEARRTDELWAGDSPKLLAAHVPWHCPRVPPAPKAAPEVVAVPCRGTPGCSHGSSGWAPACSRLLTLLLCTVVRRLLLKCKIKSGFLPVLHSWRTLERWSLSPAKGKHFCEGPLYDTSVVRIWLLAWSSARLVPPRCTCVPQHSLWPPPSMAHPPSGTTMGIAGVNRHCPKMKVLGKPLHFCCDVFLMRSLDFLSQNVILRLLEVAFDFPSK